MLPFGVLSLEAVPRELLLGVEGLGEELRTSSWDAKSIEIKRFKFRKEICFAVQYLSI